MCLKHMWMRMLQRFDQPRVRGTDGMGWDTGILTLRSTLQERLPCCSPERSQSVRRVRGHGPSFCVFGLVVWFVWRVLVYSTFLSVCCGGIVVVAGTVAGSIFASRMFDRRLVAACECL